MLPSVAPAAPDRLPTPSIPRLARASLLVLFSYVFLANAWMGDDAYITYRVIWNAVNGHGLTFNPDERVQAYTHPLWMLVMTGAHLLTREFFFTATAVSWLFDLAALVVVLRWSGSAARGAMVVAWLIGSKAFIDYTSSGLENPLTYLLIALFYTRYLSRPFSDEEAPRALRWALVFASLGFLTRPDAILLFAGPVAALAWTVARRGPSRLVRPVLQGTAPMLAWLVFATIYYGFPLPNTYYAKVANGIPKTLLYKQGLAYLLNSIRYDPLTLGTVALATIVSLRADARQRWAAWSAALYVAYTVSVGGDFMSGRFFAAPFLLAVLTVTPLVADTALPWAIGALAAYTLVAPVAPIRTTAQYDAAWPWRTQNGIKDERGSYFAGTNILFFSPFRTLPDFVWVREGQSFRSGPEKVTVQGSIGFWGLYAGPEKFLVDRNALSDPLLARLPVSPQLYFEFFAGHYFRDLPDGYLESVAANENRLADPTLHEYYDRIRNVTRGPLFRRDRFRDIVALNLGRYRNFHEQVLKRRAVALSIRADNERFSSDVAERGRPGLQASGRAGYLQMGPGIPADAGMYRARWIGSTSGLPGVRLGYVEAWLGSERRIARQEVVVAPRRDDRVVATLNFTVPAGGTGALDYRFYVDAGAAVTLERVELYSGAAIPAETLAVP